MKSNDERLWRRPVSYNSIQLDNLKIFYREAGPKDGPVILLLHGVPTSSRMYQPMLESSLATKYRLIAPDFPGFGHSSWPSRKEFSDTFDNLARVTLDFADALKYITIRFTSTTTAVRWECAWPLPNQKKSKLSSSKMQFLMKRVCLLYGLARRAFWQDRDSHELHSARVFFHWKQPATDTWACPLIPNELILIHGLMSSIF